MPVDLTASDESFVLQMQSDEGDSDDGVIISIQEPFLEEILVSPNVYRNCMAIEDYQLLTNFQIGGLFICGRRRRPKDGGHPR